jgi:GT2 family glycosyltransferase
MTAPGTEVAASPRVSVLVPTYEREELLCRTLTDILAQRHPAFEVIVLDQTRQHAPETRAFLSGVASRIRRVPLAQPSLMGALNRGLELARGDLVWLTDDDVQIDDPDLLERHEAAHADATVGGVAGYEHDPRRPAGSRYDARSSDPVWGWYYSAWDHGTRADVVTAPGCNVSFKRRVLREIGGFDERFTGNAVRWENDVCLRVRRAGYRVVFEPEAKVIHAPSASPGGCENRHLLGREPQSHGWYATYFRNMLYVTFKHLPRRVWLGVAWRLYRNHVMNRPLAREGVGFLVDRHRALLLGAGHGWRSYREWRRQR